MGMRSYSTCNPQNSLYPSIAGADHAKSMGVTQMSKTPKGKKMMLTITKENTFNMQSRISEYLETEQPAVRLK